MVGASVPEASVNEHGNSLACEDDVGTYAEIGELNREILPDFLFARTAWLAEPLIGYGYGSPRTILLAVNDSLDGVAS